MTVSQTAPQGAPTNPQQEPGGQPSGASAILALDLGSRTGWAAWLPDAGITSGVELFRHDRWQGGGMKFLRFKRWLTDIRNAAGALEAVYYEEVRAHRGVDASHAYGGWLAILTAWCEHHRIPYQGVPVGVIKRHATGKGNAGKEAVIAAMRARGHEVGDDNQADALALLHWALDQEAGR